MQNRNMAWYGVWSAHGRIMAVGVLALGLAASAAGQPTNTSLVALGFTNTAIGEMTWLEVIDQGVLFVHDTADGAGVSVQLGEADSGVFLFPVTGYLFEGDTMEGRAYGSLNGAGNQFISSVKGVHTDGSTVDVTIDFSALGATRLNVFADSRFVGQITNSVGVINVYGNGYGCRANPWWHMPDGRFGALIELADIGSWATVPPVNLDSAEFTSSYVFVQPDDPTNSVQYISRVDVTSINLGSFCLTDARLGMFHQRHKALGQEVTLTPATGQLVVGNLFSNLDGVLVELPGVSGFEMDFLPIDLPTTNSTMFLIAGPGNAWFNRSNGPVQVVAQTITDVTRLVVRSHGAVVGSVLISSNTAAVDLSGSPRLTGCGVMVKTAENLPGIGFRLDRLTTFTTPGGETFEGDELMLFATEPAFYEALPTCAVLANEIPSFTITGERVTPLGPPPTLNIARSSGGITLSWTDVNRVYGPEVTTNLAAPFETLTDPISYTGDRAEVTLYPAESSRFFRLRHYVDD